MGVVTCVSGGAVHGLGTPKHVVLTSASARTEVHTKTYYVNKNVVLAAMRRSGETWGTKPILTQPNNCGRYKQRQLCLCRYSCAHFLVLRRVQATFTCCEDRLARAWLGPAGSVKGRQLRLKWIETSITRLLKCTNIYRTLLRSLPFLFAS